MVVTYMKRIRHSILCVTGVYFMGHNVFSSVLRLNMNLLVLFFSFSEGKSIESLSFSIVIVYVNINTTLPCSIKSSDEYCFQAVCASGEIYPIRHG